MKNATQASNRRIHLNGAPFVSLAVGLLGLISVGCGGVLNSGVVERESLQSLATDHRPAIAAAASIGKASEALGRAAPEEATAWLEAALEYRTDLVDDGALRDLVVELEREDMSPALLAVQSTELARRALMTQQLQRASQLADEARRSPEASRLTQRRADLVALLARPKRTVDPGAEAYAAEISRIRRQPIPGRLGADLKLRLTMLEAAVHQEKGRYQKAISLYLSVPMDSGMYRPARLGLAWCQFRIGHAQRALKILALLPGGLGGDPERAVLAAMAAHGLGQIDAAQAIILEALNRRPDLEAETVEIDGVLRVIEEGQVRPLLRGPAEGLTIMVASSSEVLAIAQTLLESQGVAERLERAYVDGARARLKERVEAETGRQLRRLQRAWEALERLAPQIR